MAVAASIPSDGLETILRQDTGPVLGSGLELPKSPENPVDVKFIMDIKDHTDQDIKNLIERSKQIIQSLGLIREGSELFNEEYQLNEKEQQAMVRIEFFCENLEFQVSSGILSGEELTELSKKLENVYDDLMNELLGVKNEL